MAILHCIRLYVTVLDSTVLYHGSTLLYTRLNNNLPWLYFTLLESTLFYHVWTSIYMSLDYSTMALVHTTSLYITLPYHGSSSLY